VPRLKQQLGAWTGGDIGAVSPAGSASVTGGTYTVSGAGADIWYSADAFEFVSEPLTGDGSITARVVSQTNSNVWAKAGVMFRETLTPGSTFAAVEVTPGNGAVYQARTATSINAISFQGPTTITAPYWVQVVRSGTTFTGSISPDGITWTTLGTYTIAMAAQIYVGLAVTSHNDGTLSTTVFDNVTVSGSAPKVAVSVAPTTAALNVGGTQQFTATVTNATNTAVTWQVNGVVGGSATTGTVSATGLYTAPASLSASPSCAGRTCCRC